MGNGSTTRAVETGIIYAYDQRVPPAPALFAALQHFLAVFVGIITPPVIIGRALGLPMEMTSYMVNMALFVSGVATFIQARRIGPIGSGLLSVQGTSFAFIATLIGVGAGVMATGGSPEAAIATISGVCLAGCFIEMILSRFLTQLRRVFPPLVSGIVVTLIGMSLIRVGVTDFGGGFAAKAAGTFGSLQNLGLGFLVMVIILALNCSRRPMVRMSSVAVGLIVGYLVAAAMGRVDLAKVAEADVLVMPTPLKYGLGFSLSGFIGVGLLYIITTIESIGDLTATSLLSGAPIKGPRYWKAISGGVLGDGFNSGLAALFNTFPNTTFSQNNGIIQLTGVGSRYVGYYIAAMLAIAGVLPIVGNIFAAIPPPVLGGATIILFGTVAAAGIKIISTEVIDKRSMLIMATSFGVGLGVSFAPDVLNHLPGALKNILSSGITSGGLTAIILNLLVPREKEAVGEDTEAVAVGAAEAYAEVPQG